MRTQYLKPKRKLEYVTRAQALRKTCLSLDDFRRLCIIKGIYPRVPNNPPKTRNNIYYHLKDVKSILHDPLCEQIRKNRVVDKKIKKAVNRDEISVAKHREQQKTKLAMHHVVKERYPTLLDAVRDLDDPLSTLAMFAAIKADESREISFKTIRKATKLMDEFHHMICCCGRLTKCFVTIKGYYLEAEILGTPVTWLMPHPYYHNLPYEVDFKILMTFADFYMALIHFVNFKIFALEELSYPPMSDPKVADAGGRHLALKSARVSADAPPAESQNDDAEMEGSQPGGGSSVPLILSSSGSNKGVFKGLTVFVCREVPLSAISIVLCSGGARLGWDDENSPVPMESPLVTHQIVDRTMQQCESLFGSVDYLPPREYVQPQWVFDSLNAGKLLATRPYAPGVPPPPHLSPFVAVDDEDAPPMERPATASTAAADAEAADASDEEDAEDEGGYLRNLAVAAAFQDDVTKEYQTREQTQTLGEVEEAATVNQEAPPLKLKVVPPTAAVNRGDSKKRQLLERQLASMSKRKKNLRAKLLEGKKCRA